MRHDSDYDSILSSLSSFSSSLDLLSSSSSSPSSFESIPSSTGSYTSPSKAPPDTPLSSGSRLVTQSNQPTSFPPSCGDTSRKPASLSLLQEKFAKASDAIRRIPSISKRDDHLRDLVTARAIDLMTAVQQSSTIDGKCSLSPSGSLPPSDPAYNPEELEPYEKALQAIVSEINSQISPMDPSSRVSAHLDAASHATHWAYSLFDTAGPVHGNTQHGKEMEKLLASFSSKPETQKERGRLRQWFHNKLTSSSSSIPFTEPQSVYKTSAIEAHNHYLDYRSRQPSDSNDWKYRGQIAWLIHTSIAAAKEAKESGATYSLPEVSVTANVGDGTYSFSVPISNLGRSSKPNRETVAGLGTRFGKWLKRRPNLGSGGDTISVDLNSCGSEPQNLFSLPLGSSIVHRVH